MPKVPSEYQVERAPADHFAEDDPDASYWIRDGQSVYHRHRRVRGADPATFRFYLGGFAKDARACYSAGSRLRHAHPDTFRALNLTYAADERRVWTLGGEIKAVNRETFEVCDAGADERSGARIPTGYARDRHRVYYYNFDGKPNVVRKADPLTFTSIDGVFAIDERQVFFELSALPKASRPCWRLLMGNYSRDDARVYYCNRLVHEAAAETFRVIDTDGIQLAVDADRYYANGFAVSKERFDGLQAQKAELRRKFPPARE